MSDTNSIHEISLQAAVDMTTKYRQKSPANFPLYESFNVEAIKSLINNENCGFLRIYFGRKENDEVELILVAADGNGEDLLPGSGEGNQITGDGNKILQDGFRCPQFCPSHSVLAGNNP